MMETHTVQPDIEVTTLEGLRERGLELHRAASEGDFETVLASYRPDIVWINGPTAGPWEGRFVGVDAVANMFSEYMEFLEGSFTMDVIDVCVSDDRAISYLLERGEKDGKSFANRAVWIARLDGELIWEVQAVDLDTESLMQFWAAVAGT